MGDAREDGTMTPPPPEDFLIAEPLMMFVVGRYVGGDLSKA